jgi:DNA repair protein RecN (Recombination protein N)
MLTGLSIRDVVLIERLDLELGPGLTVLTGETGAGKSILLDALGLALGGRAERELVRRGAERALVAASFAPPADHPARRLLAEQGLVPADGSAGEIWLRRSLTADGKSRAFLDDAPVASQLLRRLGESLVAVHGQHDTHGLLDPAVQRAVLDAFAGAEGAAAATRAAWQAWRTAEARRRELAEAAERAERDAEELRQRVAELEALAPQPGEEGRLAEARARLQGRERLLAALQEGLGGAEAARERLAQAARRLERVRTLAESELAPALAALERAQVELDEAENGLEALQRGLATNEDSLESIETRLFALRAAARKHRVPVEGLTGLLEGSRAELARLRDRSVELAAAEREVAAAEAAFRAAAARLSGLRAAAAEQLALAVSSELAPLRLERARFEVALEPLPEADWGPEGAERVSFRVATNPGQPPGPLAKIASGGELSRLMLALEVVLARLDPTPTLVFDEIDAGIGGATADAVGERLARLGRDRQVLVVTHAPQVAARADRHLLVRKRIEAGAARVEVEELGPAGRRQEIARMLAGAEITEAARAAAQSLLELARRG